MGAQRQLVERGVIQSGKYGKPQGSSVSGHPGPLDLRNYITKSPTVTMDTDFSTGAWLTNNTRDKFRRKSIIRHTCVVAKITTYAETDLFWPSCSWSFSYLALGPLQASKISFIVSQEFGMRYRIRRSDLWYCSSARTQLTHTMTILPSFACQFSERYVPWR